MNLCIVRYCKNWIRSLDCHTWFEVQSLIVAEVCKAAVAFGDVFGAITEHLTLQL